MTATPRERRRQAILRAVLVIGGLLAAMWVLEGIDVATANSLDQFGIRPREVDTVGNIALAPWIHYGWLHLIGNSGPFLVLGVLTFLSGVVRWLATTVASVLSSGLLVWLISPNGTITAGASGLIFGWLSYLLVRGFFTRRPGQIALAVVVLLLYGGILVGVLPGSAEASWQAHLGGAVGGALAAWLMHGRAPSEQPVTA